MKKLNGWHRKFRKGVTLAHHFHDDVARCGYVREENRKYVEIDVTEFPENKVCPLCKGEKNECD